jgi:menaquinol-cytochrome c reductase cytochrome b/c subunit
MVDIPEDLLRRSAEAKAKALGLPVEQVLAEMKGERPPAAPEPAATPSSGGDQPAASEPEASEPEASEPDEAEPTQEPAEAPAPAPTPAPAPPPAPAAPPAAGGDVDVLVARAAAASGLPANLVKRSAEAKARSLGLPLADVLAEMAGDAPPAPTAAAAASDQGSSSSDQPAPAAAEPEPAAAAVATAEAPPAETPPAGPPANGGGNGRKAAVVSARPVAPPANVPEGVRTQRLLTVVKARAIQNVKAEPTDKVNTWPHLMLAEFVALLAMTAFLLILSVILQAPLLEPANFNATPNPSKAPWYFLGLQELLSYFDPQIAGVTVPTIIGLIGFMMIPYIDRNPSTKPSDRKFAIMLYTIFLTGSATLTVLGVLFRGKGFNFAYPWRDGIFFDDLKDWVHFE